MALRLLLRIVEPIVVDEYNARIRATINNGFFELLLVFKGAYVKPETLLFAKSRNIKVANYYPDTSLFAWGKLLPSTLPLYDVLFFTKPFHEADAKSRLRIGNCVHLPHGYDATVHYPIELTLEEKRRFGSDLVFVGTMTPYKEDLLAQILDSLSNALSVSIWGAGWSRSKYAKVRNFVKGGHLVGISYTKALLGAKAALAITSGPWAGASQGDEVTTRSFQIPAMGQVMIHSRNPEILTYYVEGKEILCFQNVSELREILQALITDPNMRRDICTAGYQRAVPAYSYDQRMKTLVDYVCSL